MPDPARSRRRRLHDQRPSVALRRERPGDRAHRGLVPAVPEPHRRLARLRAGGRAVRVRRRRRELQRGRLGPARRPATRAATRRSRWRATAPEQARAAPCAARTSAPPAIPTGARRLDPARQSGHGHRAGRPTRTSAAATPTRDGSSPTACATRSASRSAPAPTSLGRRRRLGHVGGDQPDPGPDRARPRNFGWPCYEGDRVQSGQDNATRTSARRSAQGATAHTTPTTRTTTTSTSSPASLPERQLVISGLAFLPPPAATRPATTTACSSPTTAASASGYAPDNGGCPNPGTISPSPNAAGVGRD